MTTIGLGFTLSANATKLASGADAASAALTKIGKSAQQTARDVSMLKTIEIGRLMGSGLSMASSAFSSVANSLSGYVASTTNALDATQDLSERIGVGVEALQSLQMAAKLSGVEDITGAMQKLAVNIGKAAESGAVEDFAKLGLEFDKLVAMAPEEQFREVAKAISALPTEAQRAAAAVSIFGKSGVELLPLFGKNVADVEARMRRLGAVVSQTGVENVAGMNDALDLVRKTIGGIIGQVVGNLAPAVSSVAEEFLSFVESFNGGGGNGLADAITRALFSGAEALASVFDRFTSQFGDWIGSFNSFDATLADTSSTFASVADAFTAVGETMQYVFNIFEVTGNNLAVGLGKVVENIGWAFGNDTAEQFGKIMAEEAAAKLEKNIAEMNAAKAAAGAAATDALLGRAPGAPQGPGAAARGVAAARAAFDNRNSPEVQQQRALQKMGADFARKAAADKAEWDRKMAEKAKLAEEQRVRDEKGAEKLQGATEFKREARRALGMRASEALKVGDVRSSEGMATFMALASGREDPAIEQYRESNTKLQRIIDELRAQNVSPAVILGGAEG